MPYLSTYSLYPPTLIGTENYTESLAPGDSVDKTLTAVVPNIAKEGQKYLVAKVVNGGTDGTAYNDTKANYDRDWFGAVAADAYDAAARNDTMPTATNLGLVEGTLSRPNLTLDTVDVLAGDVDWYKFSISKPASVYDSARINFNNTEGDLTLDLFDAIGNVLGTSDTAGYSEQVSLNGLPVGDYYLRILGKNGDISRGYTLSLRTPA